MHNLPQNERPRERMFKYGPSNLSAVELVTILLNTGSKHASVTQLAQRILSHFGGLHQLAQISPPELEQFHGLGKAKTATLVAALEIGKRIMSSTGEDRPIIKTSDDAAHLVSDMAYLQQEHIRVILLDNSRRVIAIPTVYIATLNAVIMRVPEIFKEAITRNAPALILVHNHPSGDFSPSPEDIQLTKKLVQAGEILDIVFLDHIIIGKQGWCSLKDMGLGFPT